MRIVTISILVAGLLTSTSVNANPLLEGCRNQCWNNYQARMAYCWNRHGGLSYEAEWCMIDEYDVYMSCMNDCETTYGSQASLNFQSAHPLGKQGRCGKVSKLSARA